MQLDLFSLDLDELQTVARERAAIDLEASGASVEAKFDIAEVIAVAKAKKAAAEKAKSERVMKLQRAISLRASHAADAKLEVPAPEGLAYLPYQRAGVAYALKALRGPLERHRGLGVDEAA